MENTRDSILDSVKKMIGPSVDYTVFDDDLIMIINAVFNILKQLGIGPAGGYQIESKDDLWTDFMPTGPKLNMIKTYMYAKVRLIFDPPQNSTISQALKDVVNEVEFRANIDAETPCFIYGE